MLVKLDLNSDRWRNLDGNKVPDLIRRFTGNPSAESDVFYELTDSIWDSGVCKPCFFATIPYLIEVTANQPFENSKDLWGFLGSWISNQEFYRQHISQDILEWFDNSIKYAEEVCTRTVAQIETMDYNDASYLYASLFVFANHGFGYMAMSGYKDDIEGTSIAKCRNGHFNDVTVYNSGIVAYEEAEQPRCIPHVPSDCFQYSYIKRKSNPWNCLNVKIEQYISNTGISPEIQSHLKLASMIINNGVYPELPMKFAFSLYGSLLFCNGDIDAATRIFHGWDTIKCQTCGDEYLFAEHWCEKEVR